MISRKTQILALSFALLVLIFTAVSFHQNKPLYKDTRVMMGTFVEVVSSDKRAAEIVFNEIYRIEELLSKYKENSEISKLNSAGQLKVSPETFYILEKSKEFWKDSSGAFDVTVGPLMDLWGFSEKKFRVPAEAEIAHIKQKVGMDKIVLNKQDSVVKFKIPGMVIDLGAIAKGFALDCSVKRLKESGINSCLINAGGQVYCLGKNNGRPWKVAIKDPRGNKLIADLDLEDKSVSTSGDYEQYFVKDGRSFCHILNPKTGYPVDSGVISITIEASDGLTADALSTSVFVLGKDEGSEFLKKYPDARSRIIMQ